MLEVLHLVEVGAPVQLAVAQAGPALQADGAAQALAALGEVPHHAVVPTVGVAAGAGHVVVLAHAPVGRVVEHQLAAQRRGGHGLLRHRGNVLQEDGGRAARGQHVGHVVCGDRARQEVVDEQALARGVQVQAVRRAAGADLAAHGVAVGVDDGDVVALHLRHEQVIASR